MTNNGMTNSSIFITIKQKKWIDERNLNLSKFVRKKIDEEMEKWQG